MKHILAIIIFLLGEIVAYFIFIVVKRWGIPNTPTKASKLATAKGILERLTLFTGILYGFPQIIIAFSALKLGTRLHEERENNEEGENKISNNYFLVGNLISIFLAMVYAIVVRAICPVP